MKTRNKWDKCNITPKASKLVPGSLLPHWNSMRFCVTGSLYYSNSMEEVKFATLYRRSSKTSQNIVTCTLLCWDYVTYMPAVWNFQKADFKPYSYGQKYTTFLFPYMGHSLQIFAWGMPLQAHVFSFTHNAVVLSHFRCVHRKNQTKNFLV